MKDIRKHNQLAIRVRAIRRALASLAADLERIERDLAEDHVGVKGRPGEDGMTVGQRISNTRIARGMTQKDLARQAGMTASQLCRSEHDVNDLSARIARRVADALDVPLAWLLCGGGK